MYASLIVLRMEKTPGLGLSALATNPQSKAVDASLRQLMRGLDTHVRHDYFIGDFGSSLERIVRF